jgi:hypothetical protein
MAQRVLPELRELANAGKVHGLQVYFQLEAGQEAPTDAEWQVGCLQKVEEFSNRFQQHQLEAVQ